MSIIALLSLAKEYFETLKTKRALRHLDDHFLKDIGLYREGGYIRPLSGSEEVKRETEALAQASQSQSHQKH